MISAYCAGKPAGVKFDHLDGNCKTHWECSGSGSAFSYWVYDYRKLTVTNLVLGYRVVLRYRFGNTDLAYVTKTIWWYGYDFMLPKCIKLPI